MNSSSIPNIAQWMFSLDSTLIWLLVGAVMLYVLIYSAIFIYHWQKFGIQKRFAQLTMVVYIAGVLALSSAMITAASFI